MCGEETFYAGMRLPRSALPHALPEIAAVEVSAGKTGTSMMVNTRSAGRSDYRR